MKTISLFATLLVAVALGAVSVDAGLDKVHLKRAARLQTCEKKTRVLNKKLSVLKTKIQTALSTADDAMAVDCVETGNAAADCTADCAVATATVTTAKSGTGTACAGDYTCTAGDGACPANVNCVETGNTAAECTVDCKAVAVVTTVQSGKGAACLGDHACLAGEGACPADVDCVETGNTAAECTAECTAVAVVITAQSGKGAACKGDHACLAGEGACPAANTPYCVQDSEKNCASDKMITTQQECKLCAEYLNSDLFFTTDNQNNLPGCSYDEIAIFNFHADATGIPGYDGNSYGVVISALCKA